MIDTNNRPVDLGGTIDVYTAAMKYREALLMLLRAHCEMYGLPGIPTRAERGLERGGRSEYGPVHHQRGGPEGE